MALHLPKINKQTIVTQTDEVTSCKKTQKISLIEKSEVILVKYRLYQIRLFELLR